jgi:hypothetical protein
MADDPLFTDEPQIKFPPAEDIYNAFMGRIEPDLLTSNIGGLKEKYKGESSEDREERRKRYEAAYEKYNKEFTTWITHINEMIDSAKKDALTSAKKKVKAQEEKIMEDLESQISDM